MRLIGFIKVTVCCAYLLSWLEQIFDFEAVASWGLRLLALLLVLLVHLVELMHLVLMQLVMLLLLVLLMLVLLLMMLLLLLVLAGLAVRHAVRFGWWRLCRRTVHFGWVHHFLGCIDMINGVISLPPIVRFIESIWVLTPAGRRHDQAGDHLLTHDRRIGGWRRTHQRIYQIVRDAHDAGKLGRFSSRRPECVGAIKQCLI